MAGSDDGRDRSGSAEALETTEGEPAAAVETTVTPNQRMAMQQIVDKVYKHRETDGHDPSKIFQRKPNKRIMPDYYDVIKEPVALSTLKGKLLHKSYTSFAEYVRDVALIIHNAQTYNRPESGAFQDSLILKSLFEKDFSKLVEANIVTEEESKFPYLGELPSIEDLPPLPEEEEEDEEEDEEEEEEDEEEDDDDDEEGAKRRRRRGPRSTAAIAKRDGSGKGDSNQVGTAKRRGRPPKVDTPMESRIKNILKGIRRSKNSDGRFMFYNFEKLPDKNEHPHYYLETKEPLAIEQIKRRQKRKKYTSVDHFVRDMDVMFDNCKSYNEPDSVLYKDAVALQAETHKLAAEEKARPDADYVMEEGRLPLPNGIQHNGEVWKVGDWIHLLNPNDVTKPIIAQIYRTWQDNDGEKWINACWYYRPEQTVHQFEKHFFPNEVVKTGQYRDHRIEEIIDRCFVMFVTRYSRGRPRGFSDNKEVYVCESRYNEEKHKMNKIKTWASCLPDEVRDKDYEMDLFNGVKKVKKRPSPILHLLKDDDKEVKDGELPKPRWGADNAPPIVGAVYKGPRDENQSPPPGPTPSPPPQPPPPVAKPPKPSAAYDGIISRNPDIAEKTDRSTPINMANQHHMFNSPQASQYNQHNTTPAPIHHPHQLTHQPSNNYNQALDAYATPQGRYAPPQTGSYPRPSEVYRLPENANQLIPHEVRDQFQQDEHGHILFFTSPPVDTLPPVKPGSAISHTAEYLAAKHRDKVAANEKRKDIGLTEENSSLIALDAAEETAVSNGTEPHKQSTTQPPSKKVKVDSSDGEADADLNDKIITTRNQALQLWIQQLKNSTDRIYQDLYGEHWEVGKQIEEEKLAKLQTEEKRKQAELEKSLKLREERVRIDLRGSGIFKDDRDPRY